MNKPTSNNSNDVAKIADTDSGVIFSWGCFPLSAVTQWIRYDFFVHGCKKNAFIGTVEYVSARTEIYGKKIFTR